jgi:hypothetical protein
VGRVSIVIILNVETGERVRIFVVLNLGREEGEERGGGGGGGGGAMGGEGGGV